MKFKRKDGILFEVNEPKHIKRLQNSEDFEIVKDEPKKEEKKEEAKKPQTKRKAPAKKSPSKKKADK